MKDNRKFRLDIWGVITLCTIPVYALFLIYPMAHLIQQSVIDSETGQFSMVNFTKFFSKSDYFNTLSNSFKVSIAATVLSIAIGTPLSYIFSMAAILQQIPMSIEEAAISLGASKMKSFFKVTVPMMTAAVYTEAVRGNYGIAAALSTILTVLTVISLLIFNRVNGGKDLSL